MPKSQFPIGPESDSGFAIRYSGFRPAAVGVVFAVALAGPPAADAAPLPRVRVAARGFVTADGRPYTPFGVNYYRPGTGWAPQLWKQFDEAATRRDLALLRGHGATCVRVFLSFGSFYLEPGRLDPDGLAKFDRFLDLADEAGLYVHPTGPDHWEGLPAWAQGDRIADENVLAALESWWKLFAARYRGRGTIFAYDLLNEPSVGWNTPAMRARWNAWLGERYGSPEKAAAAWRAAVPEAEAAWGRLPVPPPADAPGDPRLRDFQRCREEAAVEWTRRQAAAIKAADPDALVTVGLVQWSIPAFLPKVGHYAAFRPDRIAPHLDFLEIHFYPMAGRLYQYRDAEERDQNLSYLDSVVREVAAPGKPVVIAEFGWYGGGTFERNRPATEEDQADWCSAVVESTAGRACGWLNWGMFDTPEAKDVSVLTGLFTADGKAKAWARRFRELSGRLEALRHTPAPIGAFPSLDWDACVTGREAQEAFQSACYAAWKAARRGTAKEK